jgi:transcriptional regulator GlxA family with amidase domain
MSRTGPTRRIVLVAYDGAESLDISGPAEAFAAASQLTGADKPLYEIELVSHEADPVRTSSGLRVVPDAAIDQSKGPIDTLMVAGGIGCFTAVDDTPLIEWIAAAASRSRRVSSVCSGAFLLGAAGLLDGKRATTHWSSCELLEERYPDTEVQADSIYVRDGETWTSAGVTAGIDLALAMIEEDHGRELAREVARWLVVFVQRPGGQSQFSSHLAATQADQEPLRKLQGWIADHLDEDLRVEALAERVHMSTRNFARAFRREVGLTPASYVEAVRIERAKQRLEEAAEPVESVARACGFGSAETMRRAFARRVGVPPTDYRARFRRLSDSPTQRKGAIR